MSERREQQNTQGERRPSPPRGLTPEQAKKLGKIATDGANKKR